MAKKRSSAVIMPNFGLHLDKPRIAVDERALTAGHNFRLSYGTITNQNIGWRQFEDIQLNGPVRLISNFFIRGGDEKLIFGTPSDLYVYDPVTKTVSFITPRYEEGTAAADGANPTVVTGTTTTWQSDGVKEGDQISFGTAGETDPDATWYTIDSVDSDTSLTLTEDVGAAISDGPYTIRRLFTGDERTIWETEIFVNDADSEDDLWYATNGLDVVVVWNGQTDQVSFSATGLIAKVLRTFGNMMIYGNVVFEGDNLPTTIINSDVSKPEDIENGLANIFVVHPGTDQIVDMQRLGDSLMIYSQRTGTLAQFVGEDVVFVFRQAISGLGPIGHRLVADFGDYHEFIGPDTQYRFDGASAREVNNHVWRTILLGRDFHRTDLAFHHFVEQYGDLLWIIPQADDPNSSDVGAPPAIAWVEHYLEEIPQDTPTPFSRRSAPFLSSGFYRQTSTETWDTVSGSWTDEPFRWNESNLNTDFPLSLMGMDDGTIMTLNTSHNANGVALPSYVRFPRRATGDGRMRGLISRVYPFAHSPGNPSINLLVTLGLVDHAFGDAVDTDEYTFPLTLGEGGHFVTPYRRARFFSVQFGTAGPSEPYEIAGYDVDIKPGGFR